MMMTIVFYHAQQNRSVDVGDNVSPVALADDDDDMLKKMQGQMLFFSSMM